MLLLSFHVTSCSLCSSLHYLGSLAGVIGCKQFKLLETQVRLLEYICKIMRKSMQKNANAATPQHCQFPCLGPAAVVAVNSVDVEVTSSGVPVNGGEVG